MRMAQSAVPKLQAGGTSIILDAAAAYLGGLPHRDDVTQMIAHPCHPPFFTAQATPEARADFFGGVAFQDLIVSLVEGSERSFADGIELCATIFAPIRKVYRVTPEQFALLEPAMAEMVTATAATLIRASLEAAVEKGVPREAAEAFLAGHAQIALAMCFGAEKSPFSDAAQRAVQWGMQEIIQPDWKKAFEPEVLKSAIEYMLQSDEAPKPAAASVD
jgi:hypothetical protein